MISITPLLALWIFLFLERLLYNLYNNAHAFKNFTRFRYAKAHDFLQTPQTVYNYNYFSKLLFLLINR